MDHDGSHFLRRDKRADAVDVVVRSEVFGRHILKRTGMIDARTGDQGIDSAKVVGHAMHHRPYRSLLAHVGRHGNASHPSSFKLSGRLPSLIERTVGVDGHRIAGRGQRLHNNRSDPPCTTGDKGHTAIRLEFRIRCLHGQVFSMLRLRPRSVKVQNLLPSLFGGFRISKKFQMLVGNHSLVG